MLRAIDLYAGIGGWSLGLHLAGIEVVASYEWVEAANRTNRANNGHRTHTLDIRKIDLDTLPPDIDIVVGSPPCTQFSLSNRGGAGDLLDGLKDIVQFFKIVVACSPRYWVFENVPRVVAIMKRELCPGGVLSDFAHLAPLFHVISAEKIGLPQRRKRCLVSNFDLSTMRGEAQVEGTLGDVVSALKSDIVVDPIYKFETSRESVTELELEFPLSAEEERINHAAKALHPVYNAMQFPDPLNKSARTVTATCTRVSRESIVVLDEGYGYRRLSLREKASLQGFPITYQFLADSHGGKETMIGNAMPPPLAYRVAHVMLGSPTVPPISAVATRLPRLSAIAPETRPGVPSKKYSPSRRFQFAIPQLHLKSGVRFELHNRADDQVGPWSVDFVFGSSKKFFRFAPTKNTSTLVLPNLDRSTKIDGTLSRLLLDLRKMDTGSLQSVWSHAVAEGTSPFELLDVLSDFGGQVLVHVAEYDQVKLVAGLTNALEQHFPNTVLIGFDKLRTNVHKVVAGILVAAICNGELAARRLGTERVVA